MSDRSTPRTGVGVNLVRQNGAEGANELPSGDDGRCVQRVLPDDVRRMLGAVRGGRR